MYGMSQYFSNKARPGIPVLLGRFSQWLYPDISSIEQRRASDIFFIGARWQKLDEVTMAIWFGLGEHEPVSVWGQLPHCAWEDLFILNFVGILVFLPITQNLFTGKELETCHIHPGHHSDFTTVAITMIHYGCILKCGGFMNLHCAIFLINLTRYLKKAMQERKDWLRFPVSGAFTPSWWERHIFASRGMWAKVAGRSKAKPESGEVDQRRGGCIFQSLTFFIMSVSYTSWPKCSMTSPNSTTR